MPTIDPDDRITWTDDLREWLRTPSWSNESAPPLFATTGLRAYHCTRLLDHEAAWILQQGLQRLSPELLMRRLEEACARGYLSRAEVDAVRPDVLKRGGESGRKGRVCFVTGTTGFNTDNGLRDFFRRWGGEALYRGVRGQHLGDDKGQLGKPSIVVADLNLAANGGRHHVFPGLHKLLMTCKQGRRGYAEIHYMGDVPPEHVMAIWQPGMPEYDRFRRLPRR